jgi:hypothetical protein
MALHGLGMAWAWLGNTKIQLSIKLSGVLWCAHGGWCVLGRRFCFVYSFASPTHPILIHPNPHT